MLASSCNSSCSSRTQLRSQSPVPGSSSDNLKQQRCTVAPNRFVPYRRTLCKAAPPQTAERPPTAATGKSAKHAKQEVVSYNGVEFEVTDKPELKSTWTHRAIVASTTTVLGLLFAQGVSHSGNGLAIAASVLAGYVFAGTRSKLARNVRRHTRGK